MKAIRLEEPGKFKRVEVEEPSKPSPGQVLVEVHSLGICGTDLGGYLGKMPFFSYPRIIGHELGVKVLEVGAGVTNVQPGDNCAVEPYINCRECIACRTGRCNCCERSQTLGVHCDGGLQSKVLLRAEKVHPSTKLGYDELALVETLGIGCHAVDRGNVQAGENVLIIGAGPIGLGAICFAQIAGAEVIVMDLVESRLEFCRERMGVKHTVLAGEDALEQIKEITSGDRPTCVIDATGNSHSMSNALNLVAHTGRLVYVGISTNEVSFKHITMHAPEMTLLASRNCLPKDFARIIQLIEEGRVDTDPWMTHKCSFDEFIDVFPDYTRPETGVIKAIVHVEE